MFHNMKLSSLDNVLTGKTGMSIEGLKHPSIFLFQNKDKTMMYISKTENHEISTIYYRGNLTSNIFIIFTHGIYHR